MDNEASSSKLPSMNPDAHQVTGASPDIEETYQREERDNAPSSSNPSTSFDATQTSNIVQSAMMMIDEASNLPVIHSARTNGPRPPEVGPSTSLHVPLHPRHNGTPMTYINPPVDFSTAHGMQVIPFGLPNAFESSRGDVEADLPHVGVDFPHVEADLALVEANLPLKLKVLSDVLATQKAILATQQAMLNLLG
ncbi:hypothetical protein SCHPADRAFT_634148 [Schizopora paradoxa]|uniref:Uncharacterized protein n=1 Tax=Schizopora paradoxa TaxID=27342 RepID=A0A0H2R7E5_9AGAM|nr:hypothetical protein SCHPADRAFT_634148 [Schizopora paradoxa]